MEFTISYLAPLVNPENQQTVEAFNEALQRYQELTYPKVRDQKFEKTAEDLVKNLDKLRFKVTGDKNIEEFNG